MLNFLNSKIGLICFYLLFLLDRLNTFLRFSIEYTDSDQAVMWQMTKDLSNGIFHGPCFYGQSYNPIIESILAVPLYWITGNLAFSLPLVTLVLSTLPVLLLTHFFYKVHGPLLGVVPLLISLLLSQEYLMLASIPRGFVTGIFFGIIALFFWYKNNTKLFNKVTALLSGISLGLAFYCNLNCVLLLPLFLLPLSNFTRNLRTPIITFIVGFSIGTIPILLSALYYSIHPELTIHSSPMLTLSTDAFQSIINNLSSYFDFVTPIFWRGGWITLVLLFPLIYWFNKRDRLAAIVTLITILIIFLSFFSVKVSDGTNSVFFAGARMYLAYPFIIIVLSIALLQTFSDRLKKQITLCLSVAAIVSLMIKVSLFNSLTSHALRGSKNSVVEVMKVDQLKQNCEKYLSFSQRQTTLIMAVEANSKEQIINYGCQCLLDDFPITIMPAYERRTWLMNEYNKTRFDTVALYGFKKLPNNFSYNIIESDSSIGLILIDGNQSSISEIVEEFIKN